ncbi:MAG: (2Fe-2S)-binding protein, partial [Thermoplasmata archaeon]
MTAKKGDTIASALWRNGIKVITRSIKFHRPRGLHCGTGDCPNCFANVNGVPNVRTCITPVEDGMVVVPQNKVLLRNFDPIGIMDLIYRDGFNYHHKFIRPSFASGFYQRIVRRMTGIGRLPSADLNAKPARKLRPDLLIIGNEPVAMRLAEICSRERIKIVVAGRKNYEDRI